MATTEKTTEDLAREYFAAAADRDMEEMVSKWAPGGGRAIIYGMADLEVPDGYRDTSRTSSPPSPTSASRCST